jgi:hypothetical protein
MNSFDEYGMGKDGGDSMNRETRIPLAVACVLSIYMVYLFWAWFAFQSSGTTAFYVVPFFVFHQLSNSFLGWINFIVLVNLVTWIFWAVMFVKNKK